MNGVALDHLVVAAASLDAGVRWCESTFGVTPGPGGRHALMGTHNRLLRLSDDAFPAAYLEIIAIDPDAPAPPHARWFGLDRRAADAPPALVHWVARCDDPAPRRDALAAIGLDPGVPRAASRDTPHGTLSWTITVRDDGLPLLAGALPTLIGWHGEHPTERMPVSPLVIESVEAGGLPAAAAALLAAPGVRCAGPPGLRVRLRGALGSIGLESAMPAR